ncbi:TetR/AcrR family transcriptional regulator C-terminal domain-containing protein [Granulosicoccus antarcticus]|uniref:Tetracycline repressor protein n=1 Tax=Granulosicoccus antarcticus IMCC3135 TaxID=1192854 RepID=A0A2Z2NU46_9GAMM|nr:TetR/AcrR family transcriptional regulator C-terminal domain-containing protein [Granulosicoccus antarcticus]ASJ73258.1 Tetracycline repressor protein [Granulosicoccus antarcticus IMCC3135]
MSAKVTGKKASKREPLTRSRIVEAAIKLADISGVDAVTIRKLADSLNAKPMSIYHHLSNKEMIVDCMVDTVFSEITLPRADAHWKEAIYERSASARAVLAGHPWAVPLMESRRSPGPATLKQHDAVIGCLRNGGLSIAMTAHAYALIDAFVYGFAIQEASLPATSGPEMAELAESVMEAAPMEDYPNLMEFASEHVMQPGYDFGREFEFGLDLILDSLESMAKADA